MATQTTYPATHQGVRDLDNPISTRTTSKRGSDRPQNVGPNERVASMLLGGLIVGYGLGRVDLTGLLLSALATGLICRGVAGHCEVYEALGINTAR